MSMQVILLERVDSLGDLGEVVNVKPGYARNYLIPQSKALRATPANIAYFDAQKKEIEKRNETKRKDAEKDASKLDGLTVSIIRHASESGQLYGSVAARDIAEVVAEKTGLKIARSMVTIHDAFKTIGLFDVTIALHPEVKKDVRINVARSEDEAKLQEKTGKALIAEEEQSAETAKAEAETKLEEATAKEDMLEEGALEAEKKKAEEDAVKAAEEEAKAAEKAAKKAEAEAKKAAEEEAANDDAEEASAEGAEEEKSE